MNKWEPYSVKTSLIPDFEIMYEFFGELEGGRKTLPFQGYRCDFKYETFENYSDEIYMIWPEFYTNDGSILLDLEIPVDKQGKAGMWIVDRTMRTYHRNYFREGTTGFLVEGPHKVAKVIVTQIVGLFINPIV
ncbi:hypothetical protein ACQV5M_18725 [Leptospira sp. SA-E8]|uniref:hypothetical protein n=1 Tax=Leptospira sp. SA-E8 TaxID=3422259 RepID=UPI003EBD65BB